MSELRIVEFRVYKYGAEPIYCLFPAHEGMEFFDGNDDIPDKMELVKVDGGSAFFRMKTRQKKYDPVQYAGEELNGLLRFPSETEIPWLRIVNKGL